MPKITIDTLLKITVDLDAWRETYGVGDDAEADARDAVPELVRYAVARQLAVGDFPHTLTLEDQ